MDLTKDLIKNDFKKKLMNLYSEDITESSKLHLYLALGSLVREYASEKWMKTNEQYYKKQVKQVYYFSMEFLIGRLLGSNLLNLGITDLCREALKDLGINLSELEEIENDAGLGNGGLGRLAACFLDSMASLEIPGHGCGIRYDYGLFEQKIINGYQVEIPDNWLRQGNVWEVRKEDKAVIVKFGGTVIPAFENDRLSFKHENYEAVLAVPYDTPVIGYNNNTVNTLRLWSAQTIDKDFDLDSFSKGEYSKAVEHKYSIESISQVLYPDDTRIEGKILRLKQQYFFVSAGIQSIIRRFKKNKLPISLFNEYISIHINDTHPSVAVAELMRILVDEENLSWEDAWHITTNTIAYTNHTILSEALEKWPIDLFKKLLPRIFMIIEEINRRFCNEVREKYKDEKKVYDMSIIADGNVKMAYLAIVGSHSVNGVAKLHTEILKNKELANFANFYPLKFNNKTNGITHRRWLMEANPKLSNLITETIGSDWIATPNNLIKLLAFSKDKSFQDNVHRIKQNNKINFAKYVKDKYGIAIDTDSIYDIQVKRLHSYKRQVLNIFNILDLYYRLKENPNLDIIPRTFFFGAKAAPGYYLAKQTIKLINTVANKINNDNSINEKIKVLFLENYSVSLAEKIIPCADVSEQISTTTKEASGTSNMKFMMNGAVTIATLDGANVEIYDAVGSDNIVIFGMKKDEVLAYEKNKNYHSYDLYNSDPRLKRILDNLVNGSLGVINSEFSDIHKYLLANNDEYFVLKDFADYVRAQNRIDQLYRNKSKWREMCVYNIAHSGIFSSDNTIKQYSKEIWNAKGIHVDI
ncbi:glycogen phosphorylase [Clostridium pasteurianum DSM 525 = ATCC 6013]|uniref:Alpha-1,4 glucan phosphorylase n=1 Tax=Clostridium pasteurianum DSM 525 = ATCC 6013 TaxID=1262449 RepID=A0A0H3J2T5_CLOPA|nr:glycogen/starch/alpha-glucan phosphorylase [Clostridium pasteurianum]AJA48231.1 glycogen phosphorylase [Clostridium pasteurianum DSM 525 = ATCC 6013]AJA52219.1 glycogen phosphorylase [Clostridium pasteurianum DSM 525 = ATCC 6013]AOZ75489.1 maltodextrin phosphorylase [Clostridium pasteurianum DSM 525 = ATCC 6013]AOZ79284.1 maltodextrin phosphorylase [Clostridium pasteurianum]ELP60617.1 Glycogen phosphorylase [Clostridium pasteurianum DSM 525 = ATCC 6013]